MTTARSTSVDAEFLCLSRQRVSRHALARSLNVAVCQDVCQPESPARADIPARQLTTLDQSDHVRTRHVEKVSSLLSGDLFVVDNHSHCVPEAASICLWLGAPADVDMRATVVGGSDGQSRLFGRVSQSARR